VEGLLYNKSESFNHKSSQGQLEAYDDFLDLANTVSQLKIQEDKFKEAVKVK
jgi:hypothetical protein